MSGRTWYQVAAVETHPTDPSKCVLVTVAPAAHDLLGEYVVAGSVSDPERDKWEEGWTLRDDDRVFVHSGSAMYVHGTDGGPRRLVTDQVTAMYPGASVSNLYLAAARESERSHHDQLESLRDRVGALEAVVKKLRGSLL